MIDMVIKSLRGIESEVKLIEHNINSKVLQ